MLRMICVSALAGLVTVAPASSQTVLPPNQQLLVGKYHFEEEGIAIDVSLNSDGTAVYSIGGSEGIRAEGTWGRPRRQDSHFQQARTGQVGAGGGAHARPERRLARRRAVTRRFAS